MSEVTNFSSWSIRSWTWLGALDLDAVCGFGEYVQESDKLLSTQALHGCWRSHFSLEYPQHMITNSRAYGMCRGAYFLRRQRLHESIGLSLRRLGGTKRCCACDSALIENVALVVLDLLSCKLLRLRSSSRCQPSFTAKTLSAMRLAHSLSRSCPRTDHCNVYPWEFLLSFDLGIF
jgi:hypothetical protein